MLKNCAGIFKDKGLLILGVPNEDSFLGKISRFLNKLYKNGEHANFYSEKSIIKLVRENNFKIKKIERIGFLFPIYYAHIFFITNPITFSFGNFLSRIFKFSENSLIIIAQIQK